MSMIYVMIMLCPIHRFSEDLNESREVDDDDAFTGTLFQSRIYDGNECRFVLVRMWGIWSLA